MASIRQKAISILAGNLNSGRSYLITAACLSLIPYHQISAGPYPINPSTHSKVFHYLVSGFLPRNKRE